MSPDATGDSPNGRHATMRPLREPAFRALFAAQSVSALGNSLARIALIFGVLDLTKSVGDLGIVLAAQSVPVVLFVLLGGVWADRVRRRQLMLVTDLTRAAVQGGCAALVLSGQATVWELATLQVVYGTATAFFEPAAIGLVPEIVERDSLQSATGLLGLSLSANQVAGPALAGLVVVALGAGWGLALDAATFLASATALAKIPATAAVRKKRERTWQALIAGWSAFRSRTWLLASVAFFMLFTGFVTSPWEVLGPQVAKQSLGGAGAWASISAALGAGALLGAALGLKWRPRRPLRAGFTIFVLTGPPLFAATALHLPLALILALALLDGASGGIFNVLWLTAQQRDIPGSQLSRVTSWDQFGTLALRPVGYALTGPLAVVLGTSGALWFAAALLVLLVAVVLAVPSVRGYSSETVTGVGASVLERGLSGVP